MYYRHCVFTDKQLKIPESLFVYKLDATKTPKQIDLYFWELRDTNASASQMKRVYCFDGEGPEPVYLPLPRDATLDDPKLKGIYRFERARLRICYSTGSRGPRPDDFVTKQGDGRQMILLERSGAEMKLPPAAVKAGFKAADPKLTEELRQRVALAMRLLKAKKYTDFLTEFLAPEESTKGTPPGKTWQEAGNEHLAKACAEAYRADEHCRTEMPVGQSRRNGSFLRSSRRSRQRKRHPRPDWISTRSTASGSFETNDFISRIVQHETGKSPKAASWPP